MTAGDAPRAPGRSRNVIRYARALAWLRWRMFVNAFKGTRRRDSMERLSRASSAIVPIILGILFVPAMLGSCVVSLLGGWAVGQRLQVTPAILLILRIALGAAMGVILLIPAIRSAKGPSSNFLRLALLPVPRQMLHAADMLAGLADPWIALLAPAMVLFPIGIAIAGRPLAGLVALLAGTALLALYLALESCIASVLALLYRDRRRGEIVTLVMLLVLSFSGLIPAMVHRGMGWSLTGDRDRDRPRRTIQLPPAPPLPGAADAPLSRSGDGGEAPGDGDGTPGGGGVVAPGDGSSATPGEAPPVPPVHREDAVTFPLALSPLPSELYARAVFEPLRGRFGIGLLAMLGVAAMGGALYGLSWTAYRKLLDSPENISRRRGARAEPWAWRLPGLSAATSAVAFAQVKLVLRTVHGKMAVWFTPVSLLIAGFVIRSLGGGEFKLGAPGPYTGPLMAYAGATFSMLAPQKFLLNIFANDGAGLTLALLSPLSERQLVAGKAAGMAILSAIPVSIITIVVALFSPPASPFLWAAALLCAVSSYLILAPSSALVSAIFPKATDLNRLSTASNPNGIASLIGLMLTGLSCAPPALIVALTLLTTESAVAAFLASLLWGAVAFALAVGITHLAARVVASRRENLALVAQGR